MLVIPRPWAIGYRQTATGLIARLSSVQSRPGGCLESALRARRFISSHPEFESPWKLRTRTTYYFVQRMFPRFRPVSTSPNEEKQALAKSATSAQKKRTFLAAYRASPHISSKPQTRSVSSSLHLSPAQPIPISPFVKPNCTDLKQDHHAAVHGNRKLPISSQQSSCLEGGSSDHAPAEECETGSVADTILAQETDD